MALQSYQVSNLALPALGWWPWVDSRYILEVEWTRSDDSLDGKDEGEEGIKSDPQVCGFSRSTK